MAQASARPPKIVWCEFRNFQFPGVLLDDVPHCPFRHFVAPNRTGPTNSPKKPATGYASRRQPIINGSLQPVRYWSGPNMTCFANQINKSPMVFAPLKMLKGKLRQFATAEPATQ